MYAYKLRFNLDVDSPEKTLSILDAQKREVLFRPRQKEDVTDGKIPGEIFSGGNEHRLLTQYLIRTVDDRKDILISTADSLKLGRVLQKGNGSWQILDAQDLPFGEIREKGAYKRSCLFALLTVTVWEDISKLLFPHCYVVSMRGEKALLLREHTDTLSDDYFLKKTGEFNEREESLLLSALISILAV